MQQSSQEKYVGITTGCPSTQAWPRAPVFASALEELTEVGAPVAASGCAAPLEHSSGAKEASRPSAHSYLATLEKYYAWDNWLLDLGPDASSSLGRLTLLAPRKGDQDSRHQQSKIMLLMPDKSGGHKIFGEVVGKVPAWSGSSLNLSRLGREKDLADLPQRPATSKIDIKDFLSSALNCLRATTSVIFHTSSLDRLAGRRRMYAPQCICLSYKTSSSVDFVEYGEVLNPYRIKDSAILFYDIFDSDHVLSAWRDPFVFFEDGKYHMVFAARYSALYYQSLPKDMRRAHKKCSTRSNPENGFDNEVNSAIGYATATDVRLWSLHKPLWIPGNAAQFEVPSIIRRKGEYILTVVVSNGAVGIDNPISSETIFGPRMQYLLAYSLCGKKIGFSADSHWIPIKGFAGPCDFPLDNVYGVNFHQTADAILATAYDVRDLSLLPVVRLDPEKFPYNIPQDNPRLWRAAAQATVSAENATKKTNDSMRLVMASGRSNLSPCQYNQGKAYSS